MMNIAFFFFNTYLTIEIYFLQTMVDLINTKPIWTKENVIYLSVDFCIVRVKKIFKLISNCIGFLHYELILIILIRVCLIRCLEVIPRALWTVATELFSRYLLFTNIYIFTQEALQEGSGAMMNLSYFLVCCLL